MLLALKEYFTEHIKNKERIWYLAKTHFKKQTSITTLGIGWIFVQDLVYLTVFALFRSFISGDSTVNGMARVPYLMAGLLPWFFVSDVLNSGCRCYVNNKSIYSSMSFPISIIPTYEVLGIFMKRMISFVLVFVIMSIMGFFPTMNALLMLYYFVCMFVLCITLALVLSPVIAISKDFDQLYRAVLKVLFFLIPVLWDFSQVEEVNHHIAVILKVNPISYLLIGFRDAFYYNNAPELGYTIYFWAFIIVFFSLGCLMNVKLKKYFDDWV